MQLPACDDLPVTLSKRELAYLERRERLLRRWPWVGGLLVLVVLGLAAALVWTAPLLVNPWAVIDRLETGTLEPALQMTMAALLPVVVLVLLALLLVGVLLAFVAFANERRLLGMLRRGRAPDVETPS